MVDRCMLNPRAQLTQLNPVQLTQLNPVSLLVGSLCAMNLSPSSGLLCPPLACNPLYTFVSQLVAVSVWAAVSAFALQSFACASQHWSPVSASRLQPLCPAILNNPFTFVSLCLHVSPSSGLLCPPLPCNPLSPSPGRRKL